MPIPIEVQYTRTGKSQKKSRNVIGVICPTKLSQAMGLSKVQPILVNMGDVDVDWEVTSPGFERLFRGIL